VIFGHLGEGNLHLVVSVGSADKIVREQVGGIVYGALREHRGSVLAEHGIGLEKRAYLEVTRSKRGDRINASLKTVNGP